MNITNRVADSESNDIVEAICVRLNAKAADAASIKPVIERRSLSRSSDEVVVAIEVAGVNPSDVKAATGLMPHAVFPRTPGRDFSGVVVDGPREWMGKAVFGTSGDLGIRRDGTHASRKHVLIMGVNGKVGQAAVQLATWQGAKVIGVVRKDEPYEGHANAPIEIVNSATTNVAKRVRELTDGRGADIVFNTVGDPYFRDANGSLAKAGCQILIAAVHKIVEFNILEFYRGRHTYVGIDTLAFSSIESADVLRSVMPGFAGGFLRPFPIAASSIYPLSDAKAAYAAVVGSSRDRIVLRPGAGTTGR